jgi:tRNA(fMet)-specific endonuclease VapC
VSGAYMLDTNICSFIMRERPIALLARLQSAVEREDRIVISVVTYYEMLLGTIGRKASPRHTALVEAFVMRLSEILPWDRTAAEASMHVRKDLAARGVVIGSNDTMIAGHALAVGCTLVTNNLREFARVKNLTAEDWSTI